VPLRDNIIDSRFRGMHIKLTLVNGDELDGVVDDVAKYEIGLRVRDSPYIVFRHGVAYIEVNAMELHGERREELEDTILTADFTGVDVELLLVNGRKLNGRLVKVSRYEIGVRSNDTGFIIPKNNILYVKLSKA